MKTKVLFVDDEPNVLSGLRRMLRSQRDRWEMFFAEGAAQALAKLEQESIDVVVSDMRMPGMDGAELLSRTAQDYPHAVRLVLSGQSDQERVFRVIGPAHQFLSKPCDPDQLVATIERVCLLEDHLRSSAVQDVIAKVDRLPSLPKPFQDLVAELESADPSVERAGEIISQDFAMSAKVLQLVNSSFFGISQPVNNPTQAVSLLGLNVIRPMILTAGVFIQYDEQELANFSLSGAIDHGIRVGSLSKKFAEKWGTESNQVDEAFLAGMMHDLGKLVLVTNLGKEHAEAREVANEKSIPLWQAETEVLGTSHAEIGGYLLGLWGIPNRVVEAVTFHHQPELTEENTFSPLTAVHLANSLCHSHDAPLSESNYLNRIQWDGNWAAEARSMMEVTV